MDLIGIWSAIKGFVIGFVVRWLLMIGGALFAEAGVTEGDVTTAVGGVISIVVSIVITLIQHKKAVNAPPPTSVTK